MLVFDDAYAETCRNAFPILEKYGFGAACMVVTQYIGSNNRWDEEAGFPSLQLMSKSEILEWSRRGIEFGGHTSHHAELPNLSDERAEQEIAECRDDLSALLGKPPTCFAYPFGGISATAHAAAREYFQLAFTTWPGFLHLGVDPHLAPRISFLPGETRWGMWCRLHFGKNPYEICRNRWAKFLRRARGKSASGSTSLR
jgi:peptidoglycan/xylan/chitin deacetylase (PgdA/CDA1 family)